MITINIAKDFTDAPGARYYTDGHKSGEEFFETLLWPKFKEALEKGVKLIVNMNESWGYASSFISGSFGALSTEEGRERVLDVLEIESDNDILKSKVIREIIDPKARP